MPEVRRPGVERKYNFESLTQVGQCLVIPLSNFKKPERAEEAVKAMVRNYKHSVQTGNIYLVAQVDEDNIGVWLKASGEYVAPKARAPKAEETL